MNYPAAELPCIPSAQRQTISFIEISIEAGILLGGKHEACFVLLRAGGGRNRTHAAVLTKLAGIPLSPWANLAKGAVAKQMFKYAYKLKTAKSSTPCGSVMFLDSWIQEKISNHLMPKCFHITMQSCIRIVSVEIDSSLHACIIFAMSENRVMPGRGPNLAT